jgi:hypothetical protein
MKRHLSAALSLAAMLAISALPSGGAQSVPGSATLEKPCPPPCCGYDCAGTCSNKPFEPTNCATTPHGPARANIVVGSSALASTNMLFCPGGTTDKPKPYALCFFSGPLLPTGTATSVATNNKLSCLPDFTTGIANCQCQVYNTGPYYVDINSILNLGAFWHTHKVCGADGGKCKNIAACDASGKQKTNCGTSPCPPCTETVAPVCEYVAAQPSDKDAALYPQSPHASMAAVDLVSTFSYAMSGPASAQPNAGYGYQLGSTPCTNNGIYAGCMTAPCTYPQGSTKADGSIVNCACPMWQGDYQIGQPAADLKAKMLCPIDAGWVWSAANAVPAPTPPSR